MKNFTWIVLVGGVLSLFAASASASVWAVDIVPVQAWLEEPGAFVEYEHDMTNPTFGTPFDPNQDVAVSAQLYVLFADDTTLTFLYDEEQVDVYFDNTMVASRVLPDVWWEVPYFGIEVEGFGVDVGFVQDDGIMELMLMSSEGDYSVKYSKLVLEHRVIPEPATLIGLGSLGLGLALSRARRLRRLLP